MVNFKIVVVEVFAILISGLMLSLPVVLATDINIYFNGEKRTETTFETDDLINSEIEFMHEASDILWKDVRVAVRLNSANLAKEIKKIYLYKCKTLSPVNCVQSDPQVFENFIDVELLWNDISEREGTPTYPQIANILVMVKLEDLNGEVSWLGMWKYLRRTAYNTFTEFGPDLAEIDLHSNSLDMVEPIKMYVENYGMVPFEWVTKAVFRGSNSLYALGAGENDIETSPPTFLTASPSTNEINSINKDFYFIFPNANNDVVNPFTLNINPTFSCGDGTCEEYLGETGNTCCYDCSCADGQYCDVGADPAAGECKDVSQMDIRIVSTDSSRITDCSDTFDINITLEVVNPPESLPSSINAVFELGDETYSSTCYGGPSYSCIVMLNPYVECGQGTHSIQPNSVTVTVTYNNGPNSESTVLSTSFSQIIINHECSCDSGFYCDVGDQVCKSEDAITLGITSLSSYLDNYNDGDPMELTAKIFNPPTNLTVISTSATLNLTGGHVSPGSPVCTGPSADYEYDCSIPFQISGYSSEDAYTFDPNSLIFEITYKDGGVDKTKTLETVFGPVSIPSQYCGDGSCNMGEAEESCCIDCDCSGPDDYCDAVRQCSQKSDVVVTVESVTPTELEDCDVPHVVNLTLRVSNPPSTVALDHYHHVIDGAASGWGIQCDDSGYGGIFYCHLTIPATEGCSLPYYEITNNALEVTISYDDGASTSPFYSKITRDFTAQFSNIKIVPIYHCGDGTCESDLGESSSNCCMDCPCPNDQYCDANNFNPDGACKPKNAIRMVIDSPTSAISFKTCELSNNINIHAHIENAPYNMNVEQFYGTLNGSSVSVNCNSISSYAGSANHSYNCTMTVPAVYKCEKGQIYRYTSNSFSILISYKNGDIMETKSMTGSLPDVETTQSIRTMYQIMEDSRTKINDLVNESFRLANDLFDRYKKCMEKLEDVAKISMLLGAAAILFGIGKTTGIIKGGKKWKMNEFMQFTTAVTDTVSRILRLYASYCQLLTLSSQIALAMKKIEMDMVRVTVCMETVQHELDIGRCNGREQACFNQLTSCMNLGNINSWVSNMNSVISQSTQILNSMKTDSWSMYNYANRYLGQDSSGYTTASESYAAWVTCGTAQQSSGAKCGEGCEQTGVYIDKRRCKNVQVEVQSTVIPESWSASISSLISNTCPTITKDGESCNLIYKFSCIDNPTRPTNPRQLTVRYIKGTSTVGCEFSGSSSTGPSPTFCLLPGTDISTPFGESNIEDIEIDDYVISYNEETGENEVSNVLETFVHDDAEVYLMINGFLRVTPNHPMWINGEWVDAGSASLGDTLMDVSGNDIMIESIEVMDNPGTVYNLDVDTNHNYYADGILVHNKPPAGGGSNYYCVDADWSSPAMGGYSSGGVGRTYTGTEKSYRETCYARMGPEAGTWKKCSEITDQTECTYMSISGVAKHLPCCEYKEEGTYYVEGEDGGGDDGGGGSDCDCINCAWSTTYECGADAPYIDCDAKKLLWTFTCDPDPDDYDCGQYCHNTYFAQKCTTHSSCSMCGDGICNNGETKKICPGDNCPN
jgi:hypothetical protein